MYTSQVFRWLQSKFGSSRCEKRRGLACYSITSCLRTNISINFQKHCSTSSEKSPFWKFKDVSTYLKLKLSLNIIKIISTTFY